MQETRRAILTALEDGPVSGPELSDSLGCSRAAVWKHVEALRDAGFEIESGDEGYLLQSVPEFGGVAVEYGLDAPYEVEYHERIESTNERASELADEGADDVAVLADAQTGGRGRLDREWVSPSGGIWCSVLVRPDLPLSAAPRATLAAAVAVAEAVATAGVDAGIKWPNDVLVPSADERKLAGILTEMAGERDRVDWIVLGIGLNANVDADKLPDGATSLRKAVGDVDRRGVTQRMLEALHETLADVSSIVDRWREHALTLDRLVRVETGGETVTGRAVDVTCSGALVIETSSSRRTVSAGDCEHLRPAEN